MARAFHSKAKRGSPVKSIYPGTVIFSDWFRGLGLLIIIKHGNGFMSLYAHNETLKKEIGDTVNLDELIATTGNSGGQQETGVYFEIRVQGEASNPIDWFAGKKEPSSRVEIKKLAMKKKLLLSLICVFCPPGSADEESQFSEEKTMGLRRVVKKEKPEAVLPLEDLRVFAESFKRIRSSYVDEITDQDLLVFAVKGMLAELDPHSAYLDKEAIKDFEESTTGNYGGLGIEIIKEQNFIKVISPIDDTPASRAGIESGDLITNLDGTSVKGMSISDAVKIMRGEPETKIDITIMKKRTGEVINLSLTRQLVKVSSVRQRYLEEGFGYLKDSTISGQDSAGSS